MSNMSPLSRNIAALLELPLEHQGNPHITAETSGNACCVGFKYTLKKFSFS